jgi:hypothetical protein
MRAIPQPTRITGANRTSNLERLRQSDTVRVIDALAVHNNPHGEVRSPTSAT